MQIFKNIFKYIKNFLTLEKEYAPIHIIAWIIFIGVLVILYERLCSDNYYDIHYYAISSNFLPIRVLYVNTIFFPITMTTGYFAPLFIYDYMISKYANGLAQYYKFLSDRVNFLIFREEFTIKQYYEMPIIRSALMQFYSDHSRFISVSIISENFMEINIYAKIYLLICFVTITSCMLYILYDSYMYYIDDKLILKLRRFYPILSDILMEGRNLIFDIQYFFLGYPRLCRTLKHVTYMLLVIYSNCDIDIGIYNNTEEYLYRSSLVENLIIKHIKCILDDCLLI
jgi:hypothetical protein